MTDTEQNIIQTIQDGFDALMESYALELNRREQGEPLDASTEHQAVSSLRLISSLRTTVDSIGGLTRENEEGLNTSLEAIEEIFVFTRFQYALQHTSVATA